MSFAISMAMTKQELAVIPQVKRGLPGIGIEEGLRGCQGLLG